MAGGLGNQLFSYAAGLSLARRLQGDLRFDLRAYGLPGARKLEITAFGLELRPWTPLWWRPEQLARQLTAGRWRPGPERFKERADFEPAFFELTAPCFLMGHFQSWRYFAAIESEVRAAFDTDKLALPRIANWEARIRSTAQPVVVHVRRGDYRVHPEAFPLLGIDFYDRARERIESTGIRPTYYLFSDDIADASAMLSHWPNLVPVSGLDTLEDFRLMSLGRHFIVPNSTFAWWAAWLGRYPDKLVVTLNGWFGPSHELTSDLDARFPPDWVRVNAASYNG